MLHEYRNNEQANPVHNRPTRQKIEKHNKRSTWAAQSELKMARAEKSEQDNATPEYTVHTIIRHLGTGDKIQYVVRWPEDNANNDTIKPPEHTRQQFSASYSSQKKTYAKRQPRSANCW